MLKVFCPTVDMCGQWVHIACAFSMLHIFIPPTKGAEDESFEAWLYPCRLYLFKETFTESVLHTVYSQDAIQRHLVKQLTHHSIA